MSRGWFGDPRHHDFESDQPSRYWLCDRTEDEHRDPPSAGPLLVRRVLRFLHSLADGPRLEIALGQAPLAPWAAAEFHRDRDLERDRRTLRPRIEVYTWRPRDLDAVAEVLR